MEDGKTAPSETPTIPPTANNPHCAPMIRTPQSPGPYGLLQSTTGQSKRSFSPSCAILSSTKTANPLPNQPTNSTEKPSSSHPLCEDDLANRSANPNPSFPNLFTQRSFVILSHWSLPNLEFPQKHFLTNQQNFPPRPQKAEFPTFLENSAASPRPIPMKLLLKARSPLRAFL